MDDTKPIQPKRWEEGEVPPCTVSYFFTLLDVNNELRYCCRGDKQHDKAVSVAQQWDNEKYNQFRKDWMERYKNQQALCTGCPHQEENIAWGKVIKDYLKQHSEK